MMISLGFRLFFLAGTYCTLPGDSRTIVRFLRPAKVPGPGRTAAMYFRFMVLFIMTTRTMRPVKAAMNKHLREQFKGELRTFFTLSLLNLVFAALAMAFGVTIIVQQATSMAGALRAGLPVYASPVILVVAVLAFLLGLKWITASARIFGGIEEIREASTALAGQGTEEEVTGLIIRMITHYRENRQVIEQMILVCTLGGCCFLVLGILNSVEFVSTGVSSGMFRVDLLDSLLLPSALITLCMGLVSLLNSFLFWKYSSVWDRRMEEITRSEAELQRTMEQYSP